MAESLVRRPDVLWRNPEPRRRYEVVIVGGGVDVSAQRTTILVSGPRGRDVLAHGCALDLHPAAFPVGRCAQTLLARA